MNRNTLTTLVLGCVAALLLAENANADTYNFYFSKRGGAPRVEHAPEVQQDEDLGRSSAISSKNVDEDGDDEDELFEEIPLVVPQRRVVKRRVLHSQLPIPFVVQGTVVVPPLVIHGHTHGHTSMDHTYDWTPSPTMLQGGEDPNDPMVGSNTTPGLTLSPRTRVVRRTVVLED